MSNLQYPMSTWEEICPKQRPTASNSTTNSTARKTLTCWCCPTWYKLISFVAAGVFAALAGALSALYNVSVTPSVLSTFKTIDALAMTIIGGVGTLIGPIVGATIVQLLGYWLERWFGPAWTLIYGTIFMLIVIFLPFGIVGTIRARSFRWRAGWQRWLQLLGFGRQQGEP